MANFFGLAGALVSRAAPTPDRRLRDHGAGGQCAWPSRSLTGFPAENWLPLAGAINRIIGYTFTVGIVQEAPNTRSCGL